jgi:diaminohydroxyphosphoribosylaminopyrimidine deaminase/5-amino-6-(5-phosphoribosylamino)uracil reductase
MPSRDEQFMSLALELAESGRGYVEPNPMVGAVIARDGLELSRGWHRAFGGPHAEVEAISAARAKGADVRGSTMYVTLEPCCHFGKTPPCTQAVIAAGIARLVAAMKDPDARVAGNGLAALRRAGIEVVEGVCELQARRLLAAYCKLRTTGQPWVTCKWAQTPSGLIALPPGAGRWISSQESRDYVHQLRGWHQGVCVGIGTVLADDPLLTNRSGAGRQPTRIVLDSSLRTPPDSRLIRTARESAVIVATVAGAGARADRLRRSGAEILELPSARGKVGGEAASGVDLPALLEELGRRQFTRLLVEGGAKVLEAFTHSRLADELLVFVCPPAPQLDPAGLPRFDITALEKALGLPSPQKKTIGPDTLLRYVLSQP